jgi:transposase
MNVAGIDVAHKTLALAVGVGEKIGKAREYANTASGHRALIKKLKGAKVERVCLEATGSYHLDLALALDAAGLAIMVVNPKAAKHFAEALLSRTKTDAADAVVLARFAQSMPFESWQRPDEHALALRACARRIEALSHSRTQAKNQLHALSQSTTTPQVVLDDVGLSIAQYDDQIQALRRWAETLIATDTVVQEAFELLLSVKGIASASAIQILGELLVLPADMRAKQWVALAGLDPRHSTSGTSVNKKPRLSKAGNRHLRLALFMPALCATRHDPHVKAYYRHLTEDNGLKKIQAVCAVMRKLLHAIHGMLSQRRPFDGSRFYALAQTPA